MNRKLSIWAGVLLSLYSTFGMAATMSANALSISNPVIRAVPPNSANSAVYLLITNCGKDDKQLVAVSTPVAKMSELHRTVDRDGMMVMVRQEAVPLPAGESVSFEPGGLHLMLMGLKKNLVEGEWLPVTITLSDGENMSFVAQVSRLTYMAEPPMAE